MTEIEVTAGFYDSMLELIQHTTALSRHHRCCMGAAIKERLRRFRGGSCGLWPHGRVSPQR